MKNLALGRRNVFEDTQDKTSSVSNMVRTIFKASIFQGSISKHGQDMSLHICSGATGQYYPLIISVKSLHFAWKSIHIRTYLSAYIHMATSLKATIFCYFSFNFTLVFFDSMHKHLYNKAQFMCVCVSASALAIFMNRFWNQGYLWTPHGLEMARKI